MSGQTYITSGDLSRMIGCPLHRVTYALQRLAIQEDARAGAYRLFLASRAPEIVAAINSIGLQPNEDSNNARKFATQ